MDLFLVDECLRCGALAGVTWGDMAAGQTGQTDAGQRRAAMLNGVFECRAAAELRTAFRASRLLSEIPVHF